MKIHLALALSIFTTLSSLASAASPETATVVIPGIGDVAVPYPSTSSRILEEDEISLEKVSDAELVQWLSSLGFGSVDESDGWVPVIDENSDQWNSVDASNAYYDFTKGDSLSRVEQTVDEAAELASAIIAILMDSLGLSFEQAADLLEQLLQYRDLGELMGLLEEAEDSWDVWALVTSILAESADQQSRDAAFWETTLTSR